MTNKKIIFAAALMVTSFAGTLMPNSAIATRMPSGLGLSHQHQYALEDKKLKLNGKENGIQ